MSRALVTGAAGFIGSHLVERLVADGWTVRALDDLSRGHEANLASVADRIEWVRSDVRDAGATRRACDGVDVVFHEAAIPSVVESVADPVGTNSINVEGTLQVLEAARAAGVARVVFASSCAVYGDDERLPKREDMAALPLSPYALQKYVSERYCALYTKLHGLECVALRYFNVYGARQDPSSDYAAVVPLFASRAVRAEAVSVFGDGEQTRDFVFVGDVVEANLLAARAAGVAGQVINVASGCRTSVNGLALAVGEAAGRPLEVHHEPERAGEVRHSVADIGRAADFLDYRPSFDLRRGLRVAVEHFAQMERG